MNPFTLDYSKNYDDIVSAFKTVFGYEYSSLIDERLDKLLLTTYSNYEGIKEYYDFLEDAKSRELCIKFLNIIGVDLSSFNIKTYASKFDDDLDKIISKYLDGDYAFKSSFQVFPDTFRAFTINNNLVYSNNTIIYNRIKFINSIRGNNDVTFDNYHEFIKTEEYKKILVLINKYNEIYVKLCDEMNTYMESIDEYRKHYYSELNRYESIHEIKRNELIEDLRVLDKDIFEIVSENILNSRLDSKLLIEYFSYEDEEKLNSDKVSENDKKLIIESRNKYLSMYNKVPSFEEVKLISEEKNRKNEEVTREFIFESDTFKRACNNFVDCYESKEYVYRIIKNRKVCVHAGIMKDNLVPLMFLTIRHNESGTLDYIAVHEMIHALESIQVGSDDYRCGFEPKVFNGEKSPHIYRTSKRKYERFNETITDIFALEVIEVLHALDIYFMDDKMRTKVSVGNDNTSKVLKTILTPFMERYRKLIIEARLTGNMNKLYEYIGEGNFEELNDIIDYIDMLVEMGLERKLYEKDMNNVLVKEYINELKKLSNVYTDMDEYYKEKIKTKKLK